MIQKMSPNEYLCKTIICIGGIDLLGRLRSFGRHPVRWLSICMREIKQLEGVKGILRSNPPQSSG